jgi:hypothetical protein
MFIPPSGETGSVSVPPLFDIVSWAVPVEIPLKFTVQVSLIGLDDEPVHEAVYVVPPWVNFTLVAQLDAVELQARFLPVITNPKLVRLSFDRLTLLGDSVKARGKLELVLNINLTFCRNSLPEYVKVVLGGLFES